MKRKLLRDLFIINIFKLILFLLAFPFLINCSASSINISKMENGKGFVDYCKKINSYTMIIEESGKIFSYSENGKAEKNRTLNNFFAASLVSVNSDEIRRAIQVGRMSGQDTSALESYLRIAEGQESGYERANTEKGTSPKTDSKVKLTAYRVGLRSNLDINIYPNLENAFQSAIKENLKVLGNKRARYISPDSLGLMNNSVENEQIRNQWISKAGIDTLIVLSPAFVLDYPTRISSEAFAKFFTLFVLDWWYIDLMGAWYIENNYNIQIIDLKNNQIVGNINSAKINYDTGKYFLSQIDSAVFEKSVKESMEVIFKSATGEKK